MWWRTSNCSPLLIYRPRNDERLSWPGWLTYSGRLTHISGHPSATGRAQDGERTLARDWRSTAVPRGLLATLLCICEVKIFIYIFTLLRLIIRPVPFRNMVLGAERYVEVVSGLCTKCHMKFHICISIFSGTVYQIAGIEHHSEHTDQLLGLHFRIPPLSHSCCTCQGKFPDPWQTCQMIDFCVTQFSVSCCCNLEVFYYNVALTCMINNNNNNNIIKCMYIIETDVR